MSEPEKKPPSQAPAESAVGSGAAKKKSRPTRYLPSDRISFGKAIDLLRAYGVAFDSKKAPIPPAEAGPMVNLTASTSALLSPFFVEAGFLERAGPDGFVPVEEVISYSREHQWDPDTAIRKLQPIVSGTWFSQALLPRLRLGPREEREALTVLGSACNAGPEFRTQLRSLLDYMVAVGLVERDGTTVRAARNGESEAPAVATATPLPPPAPEKIASPQVDTQVMRLHLAIDINMAEVSTWAPERITAFFAGVAQVIAAKSGLEKGGSG